MMANIIDKNPFVRYIYCMESYPIQYVSNRTGLGEHVLRAWERRYAAVRPVRTASGHRRYSQEQVERLSFLAIARSAGHRIGDIANLPMDELRVLCAEIPDAMRPVLLSSLAALPHLDESNLDRAFGQVLAETGPLDFVDGFVFPFISRVASGVASGEFREAHLSFARARMRDFLSRVVPSFPVPQDANAVILAGWKGIEHEAGLIGSAIHVAAAGWKPVRFSPGTPAQELAYVARTHEIEVVVYSIVGAEDSASAVAEAILLRKLLPPPASVLFGGRIEPAVSGLLVESGLERVPDMNGLRACLRRIADRRIAPAPSIHGTAQSKYEETS